MWLWADTDFSHKTRFEIHPQSHSTHIKGRFPIFPSREKGNISKKEISRYKFVPVFSISAKESRGILN